VRFIEFFLQRCGKIVVERLAVQNPRGLGQQTSQPVQQRIDFAPFEHSGLDEKLRSRRRHETGIVLHQLFDLLA
jgi:hypothetical protein